MSESSTHQFFDDYSNNPRTQDSESTVSDDTCRMTRATAEAELKHILDHFKNDKHHLVTEEMAKVIKKEHVMVLSMGDKSYLRMWAKTVGNDRVLDFLENSLIDRVFYGWTKKKTKPRSGKRPITADILWKEANALLDDKGDHEAIRNKFIELRAMFEDPERKSSNSYAHMHCVELLSGMSDMRSEIMAVKMQMHDLIEMLKAQKDEVVQMLKGNRDITIKSQIEEVFKLLKGFQYKPRGKRIEPFDDFVQWERTWVVEEW